MGCSHATNCQLYAQFAADASLKLWKQHYCENVFDQCARYQLAMEGRPVPLTLLPNGKMVERRSKEQISASALFNAIQKQRVGVVRSLIKTGMSSYELKTEEGLSPLMAAVAVGNPELVNLMLEYGCDPYATNREGKRAIDMAQEAGFSECRNILNKYMATHPAEKTAPASGNPPPEEAEPEMNEVVGFLRRFNPFRSRET
ncbi:ankyrin repeat domain-containing protein [Thiohalophilus thiocyanatoxydans]|uniref:Ankyrin repeat protein n=1 Tax=Thiohalophilus thiocyanatoxydans TaxID=381308 RepID=A0A4R8INJ8_9GAMM|nr:ankyrin repeat domain-containing protein [Thiohalophilus thiocyanatoxydans]TDY02452.1 ankyrin repeat protein [Thiohalophilus thiocyanatoxydans]